MISSKSVLNTSHNLMNISASKFPLKAVFEKSTDVYVTTTTLTPKRAPSSKVKKRKWRAQQVVSQMKRSCQKASRTQCAINELRKGSFLLKQKAVDNLRALSLARKKLINLHGKDHGGKFHIPQKPFLSLRGQTWISWAFINCRKNGGLLEGTLWKQICRERNSSFDAIRQILWIISCRTSRLCPCHYGRSISSTIFLCTSVHGHLARISFIRVEFPIPFWLVEGHTILILRKGDISSPKNYRSITSLKTHYRFFTSILNEGILSFIGPV